MASGLGHYIHKVTPEYLSTLSVEMPDVFWAVGNLELLQQRAVAFFCSVKCPGDLIIKTYDLARALRDKNVTVIGGFHSPMEKECLDILLRGKQPVIVCHAKHMSSNRLPHKFAGPMLAGRLLMLSPFNEKVGRATASTACIRNEFVATLANNIFVAYAAPGSKTELLCHKVINWGKPLLTFADKENSPLISLGATPCNTPDDIASLFEDYKDAKKSEK